LRAQIREDHVGDSSQEGISKLNGRSVFSEESTFLATEEGDRNSIDGGAGRCDNVKSREDFAYGDNRGCLWSETKSFSSSSMRGFIV
jgi:hypothetical protein